MAQARILMICLGVAVSLAGPAAGQRRADTNRVVTVNYGVVTGTEKVTLESDAAKGAVVGGVIGAIRGRSRGGSSQARSAAAGAAIGGVGTRVLEGSNQAMEYTVRLHSGQDVRVITEPTGIELGDCVSVEQGRQTNVRRVSAIHCEKQEQDAKPTEAHIAEASACDRAKEGLLDAQDEEAMELAVRRIRILCED